ncbi:hypothetical protein BP6252_01705 [Coleophoma cylindrospora]|uniref:Uncharacterized protein n=1 Tax=Coleophoma cylindrospora TaxID=1849047 RepID=A0A3D8STN3_9HELO|nr:hypothetical protein BP6252_01705 [Coleophoma cylindrospora]
MSTMTMTTTSTEERILSAANQNTHLLKTLAETDYAPESLKQQQSYINDLTTQISASEKKLKQLSQTVAQEFKDHKKYRDSTMRRLAFKIGRKSEQFSQKAEKEEREYFEAVEQEFKAKRDQESLKQALATALQQKQELDGVARVNAATQKELDALYAQVFDGPTPEIPGEDEREAALRDAQASFDAASWRFSTEQQAHALLLDADKFLQRAVNDINAALDASDLDMWGVGGSFADMQERSSLASAQSHCSQVEMLVAQARRTQPEILGLPPIKIAQGNFMSDVVFDNIFSDMHFHDKIVESKMQVQQAGRVLVGELVKSDCRIEALTGDADGKAVVLKQRRRELQEVRAGAFERFAGGLPEYTP